MNIGIKLDGILLKIKKTLNRYNFEDNHFRSMNKKSSEALNLAL